MTGKTKDMQSKKRCQEDVITQSIPGRKTNIPSTKSKKSNVLLFFIFTPNLKYIVFTLKRLRLRSSSVALEGYNYIPFLFQEA